MATEVAPGLVSQEENLLQLESLLASSVPPPFIYQLASEDATIRYAVVNAVACFTARLLFDAIINDLADWTPDWENDCTSWGDGKWGENLDGFIHGLQTFSAEQKPSPRLIIALEHAERIPADLLVPLTELAKLSRLNLTVIMLSDVRWEDLRPTLASAIDPYYIDVAPPSKEDEDSDTRIPPTLYHPALRPVYAAFVNMLCDVCFPYTRDVTELQYIAAARWPGFVQPVLDAHATLVKEHEDAVAACMAEDDADGLEELGHAPELVAPDQESIISLTARFGSSIANALEALLPRKMSAKAWADAQAVKEGQAADPKQDASKENRAPLVDLPRMSKFILVAAFLASSNPAKSDLRMFGRGLDERGKKRKARRVNTIKGGQQKVPLQLAGPAAFPLDRMLAILGALLEEYDADMRPPAPQYQIPGEYTDAEIGRVAVYGAISQLTKIRLLDRTTPSERLDGPPMFKARITHEVALELAKQLGLPLNDLLYEQM
ncbi:origin recognition complex subunit 5 C-terminus-domain-containing protein [Schizophyllum commune]